MKVPVPRGFVLIHWEARVEVWEQEKLPTAISYHKKQITGKKKSKLWISVSTKDV